MTDSSQTDTGSDTEMKWRHKFDGDSAGTQMRESDPEGRVLVSCCTAVANTAWEQLKEGRAFEVHGLPIAALR